MKIGVDIGGSHIAIGVVDETGRIVEKIERRLTSTEKKNIKKYIEEYIIEHTKLFEKKYKIYEIGIAIPGRAKEGMILSSGNLGIKNYPLVEKLQQKIKKPITIRNDAKCAAMAENAYGCLKGYPTSLFLTLGTGIGGAAFLEGKLLKSGEKAAYEFGHMVINKKGIPCYCGREGCFERYASMKALKNKLREVLGKDETTRGEELLEILRNIKPEDDKYEEINNVIEEYIEDLSIGIINLIKIFEPEMIGIGGSFVHFKDILLPKLKEKMNENVEIQTAVLGNDAGMIGATL